MPAWFVRRLSICLPNRPFQTSLQMNFITSSGSFARSRWNRGADGVDAGGVSGGGASSSTVVAL